VPPIPTIPPINNYNFGLNPFLAKYPPNGMKHIWVKRIVGNRT